MTAMVRPMQCKIMGQSSIPRNGKGGSQVIVVVVIWAHHVIL